MAARYEVGQWYSKAKLEKLVKDLNEGKPFDEAMGKQGHAGFSSFDFPH
jgi:hypothetical protein